MLLLALVFYLHYEAPKEEQNFSMVMEMLRAADIEDDDNPRPLRLITCSVIWNTKIPTILHSNITVPIIQARLKH